ncbi:FadR/GntR family transcriptional regulator [Aurantiacibacter poecillastricola]|uniref:FadR/GntR family transcriptional regulator n=1 Tax=Aurantiacibacter poecillastricola TaxID=3064385 RepID=UPI00273DBAC5|nr:FadR/GntR family transcriptional regulator [Aurantiacibacter sp. 219JJ12-13]MDP5260272.1 FadR/GntR family transcriptional regulator [Aurantiacibacter sp. 219JJ12-13]
MTRDGSGSGKGSKGGSGIAITDAPRGSGRRVRGAVVDYLGERIVTGEIGVGETLPGEIETAERLDISRGTYREAVKMLAAKGLVESRPKTGTQVLERARWNLLDPDVLRWAFAGRPDAQLVRDLFEMRMIVEPAIAGLAAIRRTPGQLEAMRDALAQMQAKGLSDEEGRAADREFHEVMLDACSNEVMNTLGASIGAAVAYTTLFKERSGGFPRDPVPDHLAVLAAIDAGDRQAAEAAMRELLRLAQADTQDALSDYAAAT